MATNIGTNSSIDFKNNKNLIHVGDYICLRYSHGQNSNNFSSSNNHGKRKQTIISKSDFDVESYRFLCSEGLLGEECFLTGNSELFEDCLWEVHVQNQYSAQKEYKECIESFSQKKSDDTLKLADSAIQSGRAAVNERRLNEKLMSLKVGRIVNFGDPIQLRHVKSNKFLTVSSNILAEQERENLQIKVDTDGTSLSCFEFMPRYKFNKEGQPVNQASDALIRVHDKIIEYLHGTVKSLASSKAFRKEEVNCSLEPSTWTILKYEAYESDHVISKKNVNLVLGGQLITLQDPDNLSCLTIDHTSRDNIGRCKVVMSPQLQLQLQQKAVDTDVNVGTNLLWSLEKQEYFIGGGVSMVNDLCSLRDVNTGLFMKLETDNNLYAVPNRQDASYFYFRHSSQSSIDSQFLLADSPVNLCVDQKWIGFVNSQDTDSIANSTNQSFKMDSLMSRGTKLLRFCDGKESMADSASLLVSTSLFRKIGRSLFIGIEAVRQLRNFHNVSTRLLDGENVLKEVGLGIREISSILASLVSYLGGDHIDESGNVMSNVLIEELSVETLRIRQAMMREQGLLDVLLDIIETTETNIYNRIIVSMHRRDSIVKSTFELVVDAPEKKDLLDNHRNSSPGNKDEKEETDQERKSKLRKSLTQMRSKGTISDNINSEVRSVTRDDKKFYGKGFDEDQETSVSKKIAKNCLKTLLYCIRHNKTNQLHISDRMSLIMNLATEQQLSVFCLEELLHNLQILQTKLREQEINIFIKLLLKHRMNTTILKLLQKTCSCPNGVDSTQRMVTYALFGTPINIPFSLSNTSSKTLDTPDIEIKRAMTRATLFRKNTDNSDIFELSKSISEQTCDFLIQFDLDITSLQLVKWDHAILYNSNSTNGNDIMGYRELMKGLPTIYITWKSASKDEVDMQKLFGFKDRVPLSQFFSAKTERNNSQIQKKASIDFSPDNKKIVSRHRGVFIRKNISELKMTKTKSTLVDITSMKENIERYFITQLYLIADLCLDRNYVAIGILENKYKYELLISILKQSDIPEECKAPISRILQCLYIDREPQVNAKYPRYIRTSKSLGYLLSIYSY